ncbi:MAG: AfsR/SARP family transcriptional regulator, partial [Chloroflexota bacterium]
MVASAVANGVETLRLQLLGSFRICVGDRPVGESAWRLRKAKTLIKLLALAPGHRLHREQVAAVLWPDLDSAAASNNLKQALHIARRALEPSPADAGPAAGPAGHPLPLQGEL